MQVNLHSEPDRYVGQSESFTSALVIMFADMKAVYFYFK